MKWNRATRIFVRRMGMRWLGLAMMCAACAAHPAAPVATGSPFRVAIEGNCAKLHVDEAGPQTVVVLGTYGLDEATAWSGKQTAHAAQALAFVREKERTATMEPDFLAGLPLSSRGWIEGDVQIGGGGSGGLWLERVVRTPAAINKGSLFEVARDGFSWSGHSWRPSLGRDSLTRGPHTTLPVAAMFCDERAFSLLASERAPDGTTFVAGRCEDELHRPNGGLGLARYDVRTRQWQRLATPAGALFDGPDAIVNAGIVVVSPDEAWVHAYRPFRVVEGVEMGHERGYLLHVNGSTATQVPFEGSVVAISRAPDAKLWAVASFSELRQLGPDGRWTTISLPPLGFVEPVPAQIRVLDVQATAHGVWVHGAVPIVRSDGSAGREHVLFTTVPWSQTLHCDREKDPRAALSPSREKVQLAVVHKPTERVE